MESAFEVDEKRGEVIAIRQCGFLESSYTGIEVGSSSCVKESSLWGREGSLCRALKSFCHYLAEDLGSCVKETDRSVVVKVFSWTYVVHRYDRGVVPLLREGIRVVPDLKEEGVEESAQSHSSNLRGSLLIPSSPGVLLLLRSGMQRWTREVRALLLVLRRRIQIQIFR